MLRAQKQNLGGIIYDDEYNEMKVGGDLDLLANVTCPENQREIHRALMEHSEHLVTHQGQEAGEADDIQQHEGDMVDQEGEIVQQGDMIGQEDNMTSQEGDIVAEGGDIVSHSRGIVEARNPITEDEVAMEHEQEVTATIQMDQSNGLCEQHIQVGELVEHENDYV